MRRSVLVLVALALGVACGGGGGEDAGGNGGNAAGEGGTTGISVEGKDHAFDPAELTAPAGKVTFNLTNTGSLEHDLTIDEPKFKVKALPGQTKSGTVELQAGTYEIYCSVAGHKTAGMKGKLTAQ